MFYSRPFTAFLLLFAFLCQMANITLGENTEKITQTQPDHHHDANQLAKRHQLDLLIEKNRYVFIDLHHRLALTHAGKLTINNAPPRQTPPILKHKIPWQTQVLFDRYFAKQKRHPQHVPWLPTGKRQWRYIVLHHSATNKGNAAIYHRLHLERKWDFGLGYHFIVGNGHKLGDGMVETSYRWNHQRHGAHAGKRKYNQHGIGICLVGNFNNTHLSPKQSTTLVYLIKKLSQHYNIPRENIITHRDIKATECPGKNFPTEQILNKIFGKITSPEKIQKLNK